MDKLQVAQTIIRQMGGSGNLMAMLGIKRFVSLDKTPNGGVQFRFKGCRKANAIRITLNSMDTYEVTFYKISNKNPGGRVVKRLSDVYADMLVDIFESFTGLRTKLF